MAGNPGRLTERIRQATRAILPPNLPVEVRRAKHGAVPVFDVVIRPGSHRQVFTAGWAGKGWPADVERLLLLAPKIDVVYAQRLSGGARELLTDHHIGWIDEAGAANVSLPSGLIIGRDPRLEPVARSDESSWTRAMLATAEAILAGVPPRVAAIEEAAHISRGASVNTLIRLERRGLLRWSGPQRGPNAGRAIVDVDSFVDEYAEAAARFRGRQRVIRLHRLLEDIVGTVGEEIGPRLTSSGVTWAVTGALASTLLAPYLTAITVIELYVDADLFATPQRVEQLVEGRIVDKGHRVEIRELPTPVSSRGPTIEDVHVALPARVYADLVATGGRSAEAANHLRETYGVGPSS